MAIIDHLPIPFLAAQVSEYLLASDTARDELLKALKKVAQGLKGLKMPEEMTLKIFEVSVCDHEFCTSNVTFPEPNGPTYKVFYALSGHSGKSPGPFPFATSAKAVGYGAREWFAAGAAH
jgi:hypothetical protein